MAKINVSVIRQGIRGRLKVKEETRNFYNGIFIDLGELTLFTGKVIKQMFQSPFEFREFVKHGFILGNKSLPLVAVTGFIMGLVLTMQLNPILADFGAQTLLPGVVAIAMFRELGPVITGLICAGKISSGIGAEIAAMSVTEQIDAMEVSGTRPLSFVVASRIVATTLVVPILVIFSNAFSLLGSFLAVNIFEDTSATLFINRSFSMMGFADLLPSTLKTVFFGFFIGLIGTYKGYTAGRGTESVGLASNSAVIAASLTIFVIDLVFVLITSIL
ncbi:MAG: Putative integral membrane protein [Proteiniphilum acetatigenes]|uniref:Putative integral membrane protein n=1 Tax=Proteiniphilum acetatigenes TaxID=294710 RepID=A0A124FWW8_9BACT|nr:MAG: Putative integral membrane protein [Proteiniphilum acetatigenes]